MKEKKYLVLGIAFSLLVLMGVTYAYFTTRIIGDKKNVTIDMAELKVIFTNGDAIEATEVYAEDNLDIIKSFSVENKTKNEYKYNIVIEDLVNTFETEGYLVYKITSTDGGYNMTEFKDVPKSSTATDTVLAYNVSIPAKSIHNYNIEIKYIYSETENQNADQGAKISGNLFISKGYRTLANAILEDNPTIQKRTDFSKINSSNTTGIIYETNETNDESTVYYYSGNTNNNWVKFGNDLNYCTYNGLSVYYIDVQNDISKYYNEITREECLSTNICELQEENYTYYVVGYSPDECTNSGGVMLNDKGTFDNNKSIYWRIIRTDEYGSIRLLYSGTNPNTKEGYTNRFVYNSNSNDPMYVGYMIPSETSEINNYYRDNTEESALKIINEEWYMINFNKSKYINGRSRYCNDRSTITGTFSKTSSFNFGAYTRLYTNKTPSYKCGGNGTGGLIESVESPNDVFDTDYWNQYGERDTTSTKVSSPIGYITADEIAFAGGVVGIDNPSVWYNTNSNNESITNNNSWWTMTPKGYNPINDGSSTLGAFAYTISGTGSITNNIVTTSLYTRPVISIMSCVAVTGTGTPTDPYIVDENNSCTYRETPAP